MKFLSCKKLIRRGRRALALLLAALLIACVLPSAVVSAAGEPQAFGVSETSTSLRFEGSDASQSLLLSENSGEALATELSEGILRYLMSSAGTDSVQGIVDSIAARETLTGEWYVFGISRSGQYDFAKYLDSLHRKTSQPDRVLSATEAQKYSLVELAAGCETSSYPVEGTVGKQGIMSVVFGLHLLNNGVAFGDTTAADAIATLLSLQLEDGGWAISGQYGDPDVTAMVLQALAPHRKTVSDAVDRALALLSARQNEDGGYSSYGAANPESCAQVIVALSALGIDACTDFRFVKSGHSALDAITAYRLSDGSFCHAAGSQSNENATQQVFYACVAYLRFRSGKTALYDLSDVCRTGITPVPTATPGADATVTQAPTATPGTDPSATQTASPSGDSSENGTKKSGTPAYRLWGTGVILLLLAIGYIALCVRKRLTRRNGLLLVFAAGALLTLLWLVRIQTPEDYYASLVVPEEEAVGTVTISIRCDTVAGLGGLPADGTILAETKVSFRDGDTVYEALKAAAGQARLALDIGGAGGSLYIRGIGSLREFDYGTLSGWMYYVNGEAPSESCSSRVLKDGDVIEWRYTRDMGIDTE